jgi:hypothetical protein
MSNLLTTVILSAAKESKQYRKKLDSFAAL